VLDKEIEMITIADLQPNPVMSEEEYCRLLAKMSVERDPEFAASQVNHYRHIGRIWFERSIESRDAGYTHAAIAEQAASQRCYWRARLYAGLPE
jgi:hypothetical protein